MFDGEADPADVAEQAAHADVVILVETTPAALTALEEHGWDERFPYSLGDPREGFSNTAIYSRFPLSRSKSLGDTSFQQWVTTVVFPASATSADRRTSVQPVLWRRALERRAPWYAAR